MPQRRAAIRVLHLDWAVQLNYAAPGACGLYPFMPLKEVIWEDFRRVVRKELKGLKQIRVRDQGNWLNTNQEAEVRMLAPSREVKRVEIVKMKFQ